MPRRTKTTFDDQFGTFGYEDGFHYYYIIDRNKIQSYGLLVVWDDTKNKKNKSGKMGKLMLFDNKTDRLLAADALDFLPCRLELRTFVLKRPLYWDGAELWVVNSPKNYLHKYR